MLNWVWQKQKFLWTAELECFFMFITFFLLVAHWFSVVVSPGISSASGCMPLLRRLWRNDSKCLMWLEMCRPHKVPWDLSAKDHRPQCMLLTLPSLCHREGWGTNPPTPLSSPLGLSCPQSLCLSAFHFSKYEEARRCFLYSEICVRLLGYVVLRCDVEGNKASAQREGEKEIPLLILFNPSWDIQNWVKLYLTLPNTEPFFLTTLLYHY